MSQLKQLAEAYFNAWMNKDSSQLSNLLAEDVQLTDWNVYVAGKNSLIEFNNKFFDSVQTLDVKVKSIVNEKDTVVAELDITVDETKIKVVDILLFDQYNKIISIHAYKG